MKFDLAKALAEVSSKPLEEIQRDTAVTWGSRAAACYELASRQKTSGEWVKWVLYAEEYKHEALEHASLVEDGGKMVAELQRELTKYAKKI